MLSSSPVLWRPESFMIEEKLVTWNVMGLDLGFTGSVKDFSISVNVGSVLIPLL